MRSERRDDVRAALRLVTMAAFALLVACRGPRPGDAVPITPLAEGSSTSFDVTIAPGTWYTINFVSIVSARGSSEVAVDFSTSGEANVVAAAFAHPRAEVATADNEGKVRIKVNCPGIEHHPVKVAVAPPSRHGSLVSRTHELAHFGFAFRSESTQGADLHVTLRAVHSGLMLMFVGPVRGEAIEVHPNRQRDGLRPSGTRDARRSWWETGAGDSFALRLTSPTRTGSMKKLRCIQRSVDRHWVGNGFPVRTLFAYPNLGAVLSPFLLLDYAGPVEFSPTTERRGVGEHPHRGFETVTIVYAGEVEHRDSSGGGGRIGPGDVQWMTAASGLVHEEFHGREFARRGGSFEMVQLWVNLPARDKKAEPGYQSIVDAGIPVVELPDGHGTVRVIAGEFAGARGPARTFTPIHVLDLRLASESPTDLPVPDGWTTALVVLRGTVRVNGSEPVGAAEVGLFDRAGTGIRIDGADDATALLLAGEPIDEPIVGSGPFVMNTAQEIRQAVVDYQSGRMGHLS